VWRQGQDGLKNESCLVCKRNTLGKKPQYGGGAASWDSSVTSSISRVPKNEMTSSRAYRGIVREMLSHYDSDPAQFSRILGKLID
jgi:hypothetical protein